MDTNIIPQIPILPPDIIWLILAHNKTYYPLNREMRARNYVFMRNVKLSARSRSFFFYKVIDNISIRKVLICKKLKDGSDKSEHFHTERCRHKIIYDDNCFKLANDILDHFDLSDEDPKRVEFMAYLLAVYGCYKLLEKFISKYPALPYDIIHDYIYRGEGHHKTVRVLVKSGLTDPSWRGSCALVEAVAKNYYRSVKELLKSPKVNPNSKLDDYVWHLEDITIFQFACRYDKNYRCVKLMIKDSRVDPSADNNLALKLAYCENSVKIIKLLLADPRVQASDLDWRSWDDYHSLSGGVDLRTNYDHCYTPNIYKTTIYPKTRRIQTVVSDVGVEGGRLIDACARSRGKK